MKVTVSHPTGNENLRANISALLKNNILSEFHTTIAVDPDAYWLKLLPNKIKKELFRRSYPIPFNKVHTHPFFEIVRMVTSQSQFRKYIKKEIHWANIDTVYRKLDLDVANRLEILPESERPDCIYAYEDGALASFRKAKKLKIKCLYDLPIGYWKAARVLLKHELDKWPDWESTLTIFKDLEQKFEIKDEELRLADEIFVASKFTAKTLEYFPGELAPVNVVPYGFPPVIHIKNYSVISSNTRPLKIIFVGGLSQRKGLANLFAAVAAFGRHVELTIVGKKSGPDCPALNEGLKKHTWVPTLPHDEVLKIMRENDVLVFPSLFEGFGLVITEAMAQGTPVITTDRTAGPDFITHDENGWLINAGSTESIKVAIENILLKPWIIKNVGRAAIQTATKRPWDIYAAELHHAIVN